MRIVMDDAGDVPPALIQQHRIIVLPVNVMFGTEEYLTGRNIDHGSFYEKVKEVGDHNFPKTSQPTPYQFVEAYQAAIAAGETEFLTVTVSEKLSGTYASAVAASKELDGQATFHLFDSQAGSAAQGFMAVAAARLAEQGAGAEAILDRLRQMRQDMVVAFLINSLEYAVKGGRVSALRSTMASLLNIKPVMQLKDGLIVEAGKVRTYNKALDYIVDFVTSRVSDRPARVAFIHARDPEGMAALRQKARPHLNVTEEWLVDMAIAVAINLGPGALGIIAVPE
ncbi:MAG: DegV family protein [Chloroflexi bacterium]|nr:DegV family protein [Chloroflexota bacterium]MCI0580127.1 DegV family protein [Chloroflexota bacterium]MCI0649297.1 DegV family protein [Chloroflexota bacterium]MCI0725970.1 DegV family protein [Chloroflexota bacterium]